MTKPRNGNDLYIVCFWAPVYILEKDRVELSQDISTFRNEVLGRGFVAARFLLLGLKNVGLWALI